MKSSQNNYALITGASSGIGAVYADRLAKQGYNLILVARNQDRLEKVASKIKSNSQVNIELISADLENPEELRKVEQILHFDERISLLVNNAGIGSASPLLNSNVDQMEKMININVTALMRLTYAVAPQFVARGSGTIINISSIVAISPETLNGVYGGSKAFVLAFTQSLHHELASKGVKVQAVLPGATATEFWNRSGLPIEHLPKEIVMSAENMVDASLNGLKSGEIVTIPALQDSEEWNSYETSRQVMSTHLSSHTPAKRYL